jgi:hypothetical protein
VNENVFLDGDSCPDDAAVEAALGPAFAWFEVLVDACDDFEQEWKFHGRKYGWKLKVHDGVKSLFELTVATGSFRLNMALREKEILALRGDPELAVKLGGLLDAEKASGGWGLRIAVADADGLEQARLLVQAVAAIRDNDIDMDDWE